MKKFYCLFVLFLGLTVMTSCEKEEIIDLDYGKQVSGVYVGPIVLEDGGDKVEYKGSKVDITRSSNDFVIVDFKFANNESVFDEPDVYEIEKIGDLFILTCEDSSIEEIRINGNKLTARGEVFFIDDYYDYYSVDFKFDGTRQ